MYQFYQIFICLLKFDFFCFVGVTMQVRILFLFFFSFFQYPQDIDDMLTASYCRPCY